MNKKGKVELIQTDLKIIYNEGCTSVTTDMESFYAKNIPTNVILKYTECTYYTLVQPSKPKNIRIKKFKAHKYDTD